MEILTSNIVNFLVDNGYITHYHFVQSGKGAQLRLKNGEVIILMLSKLKDMRFDHTKSKK